MINGGKRIAIVGSGNVAEALCRAIPTTPYTVVQVFARNAERGRLLAGFAGSEWQDDPGRLAEADIYLLAVSDKVIGELSARLPFANGVVAHTSGSADLNELSPALARPGVFYPLQTFTAGYETDFREIPVFLEAKRENDWRDLEALACSLSGRVYRAESLLRRKVHIAGVFVCNFVNDLYAVGERWMETNGMDFDVLKPLIAETTRKMLESSSPLSVQTGPAVREDWPTLEKHLRLLEGYPELKTIYEVLTEHIIEMKRTHGEF